MQNLMVLLAQLQPSGEEALASKDSRSLYFTFPVTLVHEKIS